MPKTTRTHGSRPLSLLVSAAVGAAIVGVVAAVSATRPDDRREPIAALKASALTEGGTFYRPYAQLTDALPNVTYSRPGSSETGRPHDSVIVGTVIDVAKRIAYEFVPGGSKPDDPPFTPREVPFDSDAATTRILRLTVAVEEELAGKQGGDRLVVDWAIPGSERTGERAEDVAQGWRELGRVVLFTTTNPAKPEFLGMDRVVPDREIGVLEVDGSGQLTYPFFADGARFSSGVDTVDELRSEGRKPERTKVEGS